MEFKHAALQASKVAPKSDKDAKDESDSGDHSAQILMKIPELWSSTAQVLQEMESAVKIVCFEHHKNVNRAAGRAVAELLHKMGLAASSPMPEASKTAIATAVSSFRHVLETLLKEITAPAYSNNVGKLAAPSFAVAWKKKVLQDGDFLQALQCSPLLLFCDCEGIKGIDELKRTRQVVAVLRVVTNYCAGQELWDAYDYGFEANSEQGKEQTKELAEGLNKHWENLMSAFDTKLKQFAHVLKARAEGVSEAPMMLNAATLMQLAVTTAKPAAGKAEEQSKAETVLHSVFNKRDLAKGVKEARTWVRGITPAVFQGIEEVLDDLRQVQSVASAALTSNFGSKASAEQGGDGSLVRTEPSAHKDSAALFNFESEDKKYPMSFVLCMTKLVKLFQSVTSIRDEISSTDIRRYTIGVKDVVSSMERLKASIVHNIQSYKAALDAVLAHTANISATDDDGELWKSLKEMEEKIYQPWVVIVVDKYLNEKYIRRLSQLLTSLDASACISEVKSSHDGIPMDAIGRFEKHAKARELFLVSKEVEKVAQCVDMIPERARGPLLAERHEQIKDMKMMCFLLAAKTHLEKKSLAEARTAITSHAKAQKIEIPNCILECVPWMF